jgi:hypothetical protein
MFVKRDTAWKRREGLGSQDRLDHPFQLTPAIATQAGKQFMATFKAPRHSRRPRAASPRATYISP